MIGRDQSLFQRLLLDRDQVAKLQQVQKDLVEKQRARMGGKAPDSAPASNPAASAPTTPRPPSEIHRAAEHAAKHAAPLTAQDIDALYEPPPGAAAKAKPIPPKSEAPRSPAPPPAAARAVPAQHEPPPPATEAPRFSAARPSLELKVPEPGPADRKRLEGILAAGIEAKASDIHLHAGGPLKQRRIGELVVVEESIEPALVERMVSASLTPAQRAATGR